MAHHQQSNYDRSHTAVVSSIATSPHKLGKNQITDEEESVADIDEPSNRPLQFSKMANAGSQYSGSEPGVYTSPHYRKSSLLTQALTSPELMPLSDGEAPVLTSDGGMTSPARTSTPSPPLPAPRTCSPCTTRIKGHP